MRYVEGMREAVLVSIHHDVDVALPPPGHCFRAMAAGLPKSEPAQRLFEPWRAALVHGEFDELDSCADGLWRKGWQVGRAAPVRPAEFVEHDNQRALSVDGDAARRTRAKAIVEYLKRKQTVESGGVKREHEVVDGKVSCPGKQR